MGNGTYGTFEGTDTIVKLTFSTAAGDTEVTLQTPFPEVIGSLDGGDHRSEGITLELLRGGTVVVHAQGKVGIRSQNGTGLERHLPVQRQMPAVIEESNTCGVAIDTVDSYGCIACHGTVECYVLIGVSKDSACPKVASRCHHENNADKS